MAVPRFSTCSISGCGKPGVRGSSCGICNRHFCAAHLADQLHNCDLNLDDTAWEMQINQEVSELLAQVNVQELVKKASTLRNGQTCKFEPGKHLGPGAIMGCANYHAWLLFDDGEKWLVRIPRRGVGEVPDELLDYFVASEFATLKYLEPTSIPAPKAFAYGLSSDPTDLVGVGYLLMEALPGTPYLPYNANTEQKERVFAQLSEILIEIYKHPVPRVGSLICRDGVINVSAVASNRFITLGLYGPFDNALDYFVSIAEQYLDLIADGQLYHDNSSDAFLYYVTLKENAHKMIGKEDPEKFFLKHVDDKGDHLLIDDQGNITGIIDWQFARCVPACEAFGPSYFTADLDALYSGCSGITEDDKMLARELQKRGAANLAYYMGENERARRFHNGLASGMTKDETCELIKGTLIAFGNATEPVDLELWRQETEKKCQGDPRWQRLKV